MTVMAVPGHADPPEVVEEPIFIAFPDLENGVAVFWNITRDDLCAWAAGGFVGPPPVIEPVTASFHETGQGALVASFSATRPLELWNFDDDVPPLIDPCVDTDDQSGAWATGPVSVNANDNDFDVSGTRTNSFGDRGQGTVVDGDDARWHYSWAFRATCVVDCETDFSLKVDHTILKKKGQ